MEKSKESRTIYVPTDMNIRLKEVREHLRINQRQMALSMGFKQSYYSDVENGKRPVTGHILQKLLDIHNVSADWMYSGTGSMERTGKVMVDTSGFTKAFIEALRPIVRELVAETFASLINQKPA